MKRCDDNPPTLFDELDEPAPAPRVNVELPHSTWQEVPAALFNSWTLMRQLAYCRDRDMDAALYTDSDEDALWHKERADLYAQDLRELLDTDM